MNQTLILGQKVLMVGPKVALFISTQIHHLTLKVGFFGMCASTPPSISNLILELQYQWSVGSPKTC